jgi:hypothetical protein
VNLKRKIKEKIKSIKSTPKDTANSQFTSVDEDSQSHSVIYDLEFSES